MRHFVNLIPDSYFPRKFMYVQYHVVFVPSFTSPDNCPVNFLGRSSRLFYRTIRGRYVISPGQLSGICSMIKILGARFYYGKKSNDDHFNFFPDSCPGKKVRTIAVGPLQRLIYAGRNLSFPPKPKIIWLYLLLHNDQQESPDHGR